MRGSLLVRFLPLLAVAWLSIAPAQAAAFPLTGSCSLTLTSTDKTGATLDTARSGDQTASESDPLQVDWEGTLTWTGTTTIPLLDNHYHVAMFGFPTPFQGAAKNTSDQRSTTGTFAFSTSAPFQFTGLYYLSAGITGSGGYCEGYLVVKLIGDPVGTVPFFVGFALAAIGALLVAWGLAGHQVGSLIGGFILGLGVTVETVIFSFLPAGANTPVILLAIGIGLGAVSALIGRRRLRAAMAGQAAAAAIPAPPETTAEPEIASPPIEAPDTEPDASSEPMAAPEPKPEPPSQPTEARQPEASTQAPEPSAPDESAPTSAES